MYKSILIFLMVFIFSSCLVHIVNGNEYEALPADRKEKILVLEDFSTIEKQFVYEITGPQLKEELQKHSKSLVYIFVNNCKGENCLPLSVIENYAFENGYTLFLIMKSYYKIEVTLAQSFKSQLYSINSNYYEKPKSRAYLKAFQNDIGHTDFVQKEYLGSYIFYERDTITAVKMNILGNN